MKITQNHNMKKVCYFFLLFFGIHFNLKAQIVKFIKNPVEAKYRVWITDKKKDATHFVYRVKNPTDIRKGGEWYIVTNPQLFKKAMTLFEVKKKEEADIIVYWVSNRDSARIVL